MKIDVGAEQPPGFALQCRIHICDGAIEVTGNSESHQ